MVWVYKPRSLSHPSRLFTLPLRAENTFSVHPFSHLQNESSEWMIPLRHFQVFNAIEVCLDSFCFSFLLGLPISARNSPWMSLSSVTTTNKMTSPHLLYMVIREEAVNTQLRKHWIPNAIALTWHFLDSTITRDQRQTIWTRSFLYEKK